MPAMFLVLVVLQLTGILFGTFFILIILPHLILISNRFNLTIKRILKSEWLEPEMVEVAVINRQIEETFESNRIASQNDS
jgi:hypothetical protein